MKARLTLVLVAVLAVAAGLFFWLGGEERGAGGEQPVLAGEGDETSVEAAVLETPGAVPVEERPAAREAVEFPGEQAEELPEPSPAEAEFELTPRSFFGQVVDARTNEPLAGARARLVDHPEVKAFTDGNGIFVLDAPHEYGPVRVEHEGYAYQVVEAAKEYATPERAFVVRLSLSATLVARVERLDGPATGLEVQVGTDGFWMKPRDTPFSFVTVADPSWRAEVDTTGVARVAGLPPETPLAIDVHEAGTRLKRLAELQLDAGEEREVVICIGGGCRILGEARGADGTPAKDLEVWLLAADGRVGPPGSRYFDSYESDDVAGRVRTDAGGRFDFEDVAPGPWFVGPAPDVDEGGIAPVAVLVEVTADDVQKEVTLTVHRGLTIRGRVVGPDGKNVGHAYVMEAWGRADCNSRGGNFTLGPLAPGEYELRANPGGNGGFARSEPVTARAGDEDVVIQVRRGGSISVVVRDPTGELVSAELHLIPEDSEAAGFTLMSTSQGPDGSFEFGGLAPGVYHVRASDAFGNVGSLRNLVVGATDQVEGVVALTPGVRVNVRIADPDPARNLGWRVFQDGVPFGFRGQSEPVVVEPGPISVELSEYAGEEPGFVVLETRSAEAVAGEPLEIVFSLEEEG